MLTPVKASEVSLRCFEAVKVRPVSDGGSKPSPADGALLPLLLRRLRR